MVTVRLFRQLFKEAYRYYIMGVANLANLEQINNADFKKFHDTHWQIECYHRALKKVCKLITNWYQIHCQLFNSIIAGFIKDNRMQGLINT